MRAWLLAIPVAAAVSAGPARAQEGQRFVERAPAPIFTINPDYSSQSVGPRTDPSVTVRDTGGYNGGRPLLGRLFGRSAYVGPVPTQLPNNVPGTIGVYGTDYVGAALSPRRVFLPASADPSAAAPLIRSYRTDGRYPEDVFALRPFRKAVIEMREEAEKRRGGGEGGGE